MFLFQQELVAVGIFRCIWLNRVNLEWKNNINVPYYAAVAARLEMTR